MYKTIASVSRHMSKIDDSIVHLSNNRLAGQAVRHSIAVSLVPAKRLLLSFTRDID
jgi:hypothetical protein